ncbi:DUF6134 family protein [Endozoicomonas sp. Mp262]|uniref:DUF6134 family protein n=1 Tax=Endozoicomonas sp. Mp262 TaxID=2919499 RepID=UPI0021D985C8
MKRYVVWFWLLALNAQATDWHRLYGEGMRFDVVRNGEDVGDYRISFHQQGEEWHITSGMEMSISVFLLFTFNYHYEAKEIWQNNLLRQLAVKESRNGKTLLLKARAENQRLVGEGQSGPLNVRLPILTTSHYNSAVLTGSQVLNTLTGEVNHYALKPMKKELVNTNKGLVMASRFRYEGQLDDTEVWYTPEGHWVRLWFKGDDGSDIEFRCVQCIQ